MKNLTQMEDFDIVFTLSELDITYTGVSSDLILVKGSKGGICFIRLMPLVCVMCV